VQCEKLKETPRVIVVRHILLYFCLGVRNYIRHKLTVTDIFTSSDAQSLVIPFHVM